jgi:hypothetical protein
VRRIVTLVEILGDDRLGVRVIGGRDIVVSDPESGLSVTYRKDGIAPTLVAVDGMRAHLRPQE